MPPSDDKEIWTAYAKGVKRTKSATGKSMRHSGESRDIDTLSARKSRQNSASHARPAKISTASVSGDSVWIPAFAGMTPTIAFTRKTERAMRDGSLPLDAKLDLHGMTQSQAFAMLEKFMVAQVKKGNRNLLIITGKGSAGQASDRGVLRSSLPQWLENLSVATHILSLRQAAPKHGGTGAFYVILKRRRD
jgi:DNA-nicking Smr family endonuclease